MRTILISQEKPYLINKQEGTFESLLFLPVYHESNEYGGLRKKGYFKHSYKYIGRDTFSLNSRDILELDAERSVPERGTIDSSNDKWYLCDTDGGILKIASMETQEKIRRYIQSLPTENQRITYIPLITIITSVLNGVKILEKTIQSITKQTYPNIEYIIIDGGSTDGTLDIIKKYNDVVDYWVSEPDKGIYDAWNKGINVFMGDYAAFLGSGDVFFNDAIQLYVDYIWTNSAVDYISSKVELYNKKKILRICGSKWEWNKFKKFMNVAHVGSLHRRKLFLNTGLFNTAYKIAGDYEFLMRSGNNLITGFVDEVTARIDINGVSLNNYNVFLETARLKIIFTNRNKLIIYFETTIAILKAFLRKAFWY